MTALKKENLNVRMSRRELEFIRRGAEAAGKTVSAFVLEAASAQAEKSILDQRVFHLDADAFDEIEAVLSKPGKAVPELVKLLEETNEVRWANSKS